MTTLLASPANFSEILIANETLSGAANTFTSVSIPSGYKGIRVSFFGGATVNPTEIRFRVNGLSTTVYVNDYIVGVGATVTGARQTGQTSAIMFNCNGTTGAVGECVLVNSTSGDVGGRSNGGDNENVFLNGIGITAGAEISSILVFSTGGNFRAGSTLKVSVFK